jgi:hypothetical protein
MLFTRARDGRGAWIAFKAHYQGSNEIEAIQAAAEKALETGHYTGEKPRYNFETHESKHLKARLDIEKATGTAFAENTKVRKLLYSLRCATMNVPIATIQAQENLRNSFDESINYVHALILSTSHGDDRNVSGVSARSTTFKRKDGYNKTAKKGKVANNNGNKPLDWYYKPYEWWKLSEEGRARILVLRKNRNRAVGATTSSDCTVAAAGTSSSTAAAEAEDTTEQTTQHTKRVNFTN